MARPCPRCKSRSIKHDRSLAGRAVCGNCGLPVGSAWSGQQRNSRARRGGHPQARAARRALTWLLPLGLAAGLLYLAANPAAMRPWLHPSTEERSPQGQLNAPAGT